MNIIISMLQIYIVIGTDNLNWVLFHSYLSKLTQHNFYGNMKLIGRFEFIFMGVKGSVRN